MAKDVDPWSVFATDVDSRKTVEGKVEPPRDSKQTAASFATVLELAVNPPPQEGWLPQAPKRVSADSSLSSQPSDWWTHPSTDEWIYNSADHMYFHVESSSLWERREVRCKDPNMDAFTFFRVDAVHLQALAMFAATLDQNILPMAWRAWVQYTDKRRRRNQPKAALKSPKGNVKGSARSTKSSGRSTKGSARAKVTKGSTKASTQGKKKEEDDQPQRPPIQPIEEVEEAPLVLTPRNAEPSPPTSPPAEVSSPPAVFANTDVYAEDTDPPTTTETQRKRSPVCLPFACMRGKAKQQQKDKGTVSPMVAANLRQAADAARSIERTQSQPSSPACEDTTQAQVPSPSPRRTLNVRRLDRFLAEVRRNPDKLKDHVERRRHGEITRPYTTL